MASNIVYDDIMTALVTTIQGLELSPIQPERVYRRMLPRVAESLESLPCVLVAPGPGGEALEPLSFEDDLAYAVTYQAEIVVVAASNANLQVLEPTVEKWRQRLRRSLQNHTLNGVPEVYRIQIRPSPPFERRLLNSQYAYSGQVFLFTAAEQRGN